MADIKLLLQNYGGQDDDQDEDDYSKYYESSMLDQTNPDDLLSPLEKLRKYCTSENIFTRQMVARSIVETVQSISNEQECLSLLEIITKLSDDIEPSVRCELMEQLPPCCMMIMDMRLVPDAISAFVLPVMVKYLTDPNNQVRKLSQNALLQLIEQDLIHRDDVETQICPIILQLTEPDSGDDFRTEAAALMTKITPLIGGDATEKLFVERFGDLCGDPLFHVRKVCASNFGDMSFVVRRETTEEHLLPLFARLCEDGVWGVRKACAETFMSVSGTCSRYIKYETLSPLFVGLLCDKSRWVQMAAYQALGQFIATFADPESSGFEVTEEGTLAYYNHSRQYENYLPPPLEDPSLESDRQTRAEASNLNSDLITITRNANSSQTSDRQDDESEEFNTFEYWRTPILNVDIPDELQVPNSPVKKLNDSSYSKKASENKESNTVHTSEIDINDRNTTQDVKTETVKSYVIIDSDTVEKTGDSHTLSTEENSSESKESNEEEDTSPVFKIHVENLKHENSEVDSEVSGAIGNKPTENTRDDDEAVDRAVSPHSTTVDNVNDLFNPNPCSDDGHSDDENTSNLQTSSHYTSSLVDEESSQHQNIVPTALLEHYISMTEPSKAQTIDGELPRHCAYTLPGVVLALGRDNWYLLKETYDLLSTDMQWKVRRTLAFSIHDLALILGQDVCVADLVPVFNGFLKDLDEVRVGVLKHLYDFIFILPIDLQKDYLHVFNEFQKTDNTRNWRFRQDLAHQLMRLVHLYDEDELAEYICPVALDLACDKVAEVRENAYHLLCILMQKLCLNDKYTFVHKFATNIVTLGTHHQYWVKRKACAQIYHRFLEGNWYDATSFAKDFLPSLLNLCADVVPNIRLIASKALLAFIRTEYFQSLPEDDEVRKLVDRALEALQLDDDRDVRYFSGGKVDERTLTLTSENVDFDSDELYVHGGVRIIQRGIHEYAVNDDDDDDDSELVEEVYIEEEPNGNAGEIIVEEYYIEQESDAYNTGQTPEDGQVYVEEIIEEIIETVGDTEDS